jgi:hypothetical protein
MVQLLDTENCCVSPDEPTFALVKVAGVFSEVAVEGATEIVQSQSESMSKLNVPVS